MWKKQYTLFIYCFIYQHCLLFIEMSTEDIQPTSLLSSFWEPLESGFEPLIFIPSDKQTETNQLKSHRSLLSNNMIRNIITFPFSRRMFSTYLSISDLDHGLSSTELHNTTPRLTRSSLRDLVINHKNRNHTGNHSWHVHQKKNR